MARCSNCKHEFDATYLGNGRPHRSCPPCREKSRTSRARCVTRDPAAEAAYLRVLRRRYREEALAAYGGRCECCGEDRFEFLVIDHPQGGGRAERESLKMWGSSFARELARRGWPEGYRVLCHNCNSAIGYHGYCPHASEDDQLSVTVAVAVQV